LGGERLCSYGKISFSTLALRRPFGFETTFKKRNGGYERMKDYKTNTDWMLNKNSDSIIYPNADGSNTEISLNDFLADSPNHSVEQFKMLKEESDRIFHKEDNNESERAKNELPLLDWSEKFISKTLEEQCFGDDEDNAHQNYLLKRKRMLSPVPDALKVLTVTQKRRFVQHKVKGYTTRKIAAIEKVTQASVHESIVGAEKKIAKFLKKNTKAIPNYPVNTDDY
jgi:hypothetical protein